MNIVDSSGWLEYFANGSNADFFAKPIEKIDQLIVPTITISEVFKRVLQQRSEQEAIQIVAHMNQGIAVDLDFTLAMHAAKMGFKLKLPLADSIILATSIQHGATLWTQDEDFRSIRGVRYIAK